MRWLYLAILAMAASAAVGAPGGMWLTARKDPSNQARADVIGRIPATPKEIWCMPTGGAVGFAHNIRVDGKDAVLVQTGANLELKRWTGETIWRDWQIGGWVMRVDDFDGDKKPEILATTDIRTVVLLDAATGTRLWTWQCEPSTQISGHAFYRTTSGLRFICFPSYSLNGYCFDFSGNRKNPKLLWQKNYSGIYGEGYGPSVILKDMDGDGKQDVVLGGKIPGIRQAIIDIDTGALKCQAQHSIGEWGRPYGFFKAQDLDADGKNDLVMVSCQVEEYIAVVRNTNGHQLDMIWGYFVEKDWPEDHKELRPQITSLADLQGNGKIELVLGLWEDNVWKTLVIDPLRSFTAQRGTLPGYYFWGCHDLTGDGTPEIIVSEEKQRRPARASTIHALDGKTFAPIATLKDTAVFESGDSPLPDDTCFMAIRRNPVYLSTEDGFRGVLVHQYRNGKETGTFLWGGKRGKTIGLRPVAGAGYVRIDYHRNQVCLVDTTGGIQRFDANLKPIGQKLAVQGRVCQPLVWSLGGKRQLVFDAAGGKVVGGVPDFRAGSGFVEEWSVPGSMPALHLDAAGTARLSVADNSNPDQPEAVIYKMSQGAPKDSIRIPQKFPVYSLMPFGKEYRLLVNLQTGVHTYALTCHDELGHLIWQDPCQGAYPRIAGAADLNEDGYEEVVADDHGVLSIYNPEGTILATHPGWPPAYTLPILGRFVPKGERLVLRSSGIKGLSLADISAKERWKTECDIWRYYRCLAAVGNVSGSGRLAMGALAEGGDFDCMEAATGKLLWSMKSAEPNNTSVIAGDVDANGRDEFLLGAGDGRLICIAQEQNKGKILWEKRFEAAVSNPILADLDGDGLLEIIVSTSDGFVRILE